MKRQERRKNKWIFRLYLWLLAFVTLGSALSVVYLTNIVHSALALIFTFLGVASLYLTLNADFLAAVQVLVYAGAVSILIAFGIMLITRGEGRMYETNTLVNINILLLLWLQPYLE